MAHGCFQGKFLAGSAGSEGMNTLGRGVFAPYCYKYPIYRPCPFFPGELPLCARLSPLWLPPCLKDEALRVAAEHWRCLCPYPKPKALGVCLSACSLCKSWCLSHARQTLSLSYTLHLGWWSLPVRLGGVDNVEPIEGSKGWWRRGEIIGSQAAGPASVPSGQSVEPLVHQ